MHLNAKTVAVSVILTVMSLVIVNAAKPHLPDAIRKYL